MKSIYCLALIVLIFVGCEPKQESVKVSNYPITKKVDTVDTYFGTPVPDPYRWLENDTTKETSDWVGAQNDVTFSYLKNISYRDIVKKRIQELNDYEKLGAPFREGDYYYFYKNTGLQNHSVLYRKKGEQGTPEVFLDPNTFSKDGTTRLAGVSFSKDGSMCAFQISRGGADWTEAIVIKVLDKTQVEDTLRNIKFSGIAWKGNDGFYFSTYDKPKGSALSAKTQNHKLFFHKVGSPRAQDELVFGGEKTPRRYIGGYLTEDERFLIVSAAVSTNGNELYARDLSDPKGKMICLVNNFENNHGVISNQNTKLVIETNFNAPNSKVVWADFAKPTIENWKDLIPETENVLNTSVGGGKIFAQYMVDVKTQIKQFDMNGKLERDVKLPGIGTAVGFGGREADKEVYYNFTSFTYPTTIFKYDIGTGKSVLHEKPKVQFNPDDYETKQVFYLSQDSTKIPMFIVHKKGLELNGKNPTWLYAYGGFNISLTPSFSTSRIVWLENGGIYAQPNLRGGGEIGRAHV